MGKYVLTTSDGRYLFVTASDKDDAYQIAHRESPFDVFVECELYYEI